MRALKYCVSECWQGSDGWDAGGRRWAQMGADGRGAEGGRGRCGGAGCRHGEGKVRQSSYCYCLSECWLGAGGWDAGGRKWAQVGTDGRRWARGVGEVRRCGMQARGGKGKAIQDIVCQNAGKGRLDGTLVGASGRRWAQMGAGGRERCGGAGCRHGDVRDVGIYGIGDDGFIPTREAISRRLTREIAIGQSFGTEPRYYDD